LLKKALVQANVKAMQSVAVASRSLYPEMLMNGAGSHTLCGKVDRTDLRSDDNHDIYDERRE
jgi:hypothetical protein